MDARCVLRTVLIHVFGRQPHAYAAADVNGMGSINLGVVSTLNSFLSSVI